MEISLDNIILYDSNKDFIDSVSILEKYGITTLRLKLDTILKKIKVNALVLPSDIYGEMNDKYSKKYIKLIPNLKTDIKNMIRTKGLKVGKDKSIITIGSSITLQTCNKYPNIIYTPIMERVDSDISETNNVCGSFLSIIYLSIMNPDSLILCPRLDNNKIEIDKVVSQMELAINQYYNIMNSNDYKKMLVYNDNVNIIFSDMVCDQP